MAENLNKDQFISLTECRKAIKMLGDNIAQDISSTIVNAKRIESLRVLLNVFEEYNNMLPQSRKEKQLLDLEI